MLASLRFTQIDTNKNKSQIDAITTDGNAIGTAGAIAPPQKDESILVGTTLTMETILCLIKAS